MARGTVKHLVGERGYGFIRPDGETGDVFFHMSLLPQGTEIAVGDAVNLEIGIDPRSGRTRAVAVELTDDRRMYR